MITLTLLGIIILVVAVLAFIFLLVAGGGFLLIFGDLFVALFIIAVTVNVVKKRKQKQN